MDLTYSNPSNEVLALTLANTQYSYVIPEGAHKVVFKLRDASKTFRYAFVTGKVATPADPYMTQKAGEALVFDYIYLGGKSTESRTVYFASPDAGQTLEIESWQ